jgi:hypothetical protein
MIRWNAVSRTRLGWVPPGVRAQGGELLKHDLPTRLGKKSNEVLRSRATAGRRGLVQQGSQEAL